MQLEKFKPISVKAPSSSKVLFYLRCMIDLQLKTIVHYLRPAMAKLDGKVLDVGAGESPWREWLPSSATYYGIDIGNADDFGMSPNVNGVTYYDGRTIPFSDALFDGVICIEVLEHVEQPELLLAEIARCVKKGATLLITVPWSARRHHIPHDYHRFTKERLSKMLETNGFSQIEISERGSDISVIANKLIVLSSRIALSGSLLQRLSMAIFLLLTLPIAAGFLLSAHIADFFDMGAKEDPLGYFVRAIRS
jgi:SAM-dependent methyltransferase